MGEPAGGRSIVKKYWLPAEPPILPRLHVVLVWIFLVGVGSIESVGLLG